MPPRQRAGPFGRAVLLSSGRWLGGRLPSRLIYLLTMRTGPVVVFSKAARWSRTMATPNLSIAIACQPCCGRRPVSIGLLLFWAISIGGRLSLPFAAVSTGPVAGVPHHLAVTYKIGSFLQSAVGRSPPRRYHRCAVYKWLRKPTPAEQLSLKDCLPQPNRGGSVEHRLAEWHSRAEKVCQAAVRLGVADCEQPAERAKGSHPSSRPVAPTPLHRHVASQLLCANGSACTALLQSSGANPGPRLS